MKQHPFSTIPVDFNPFAQGEIEKIARLTESQLEIWTACAIGGSEANCAYNESISIALNGPFKQESMERALEEVVKRHEALRSTISGDGAHLCIQTDISFQQVSRDFSSLSAAETEKALEDYGIQDAETPFDLQNGPLFRTAIFRLSDHEHLVRLTAHHIICDGWSFGIILEDLAALYSAYAENVSPVLEKPVGFSEYAAYTEQFTQTDEYRHTEVYWTKQFENKVPQLELPLDNHRPLTRTYRSERLDFILENEFVESIRSKGAQFGCTLVTTLLAAFEVYLHRLSNQEDIVVGLAAAGQLASANYHLVGHCVSLLPIRSRIQGNISFSEYLLKRKGEIMESYDYQQLTLGRLLKSLKIARNSTQVPLTPVVFNIDINMGEQLAFSGLQHQLIFNPRRFENFEIFLNITRTTKAFVFEWSYNKHLFSDNTIRRMMDEYKSLLMDIVRSADKPIGRLNIVSESQLSLLDSWNKTTHDFGDFTTFHDIFDDKAEQHPTRIAVTFGDTQLTYRQLKHKSNQFAHALIAAGVRKGDKVGVVLDRSENLIVALMAIMKAGAVYLPFDTTLPSARVSAILQEANAEFLLTSQKYGNNYDCPGMNIYVEDVLANQDKYSIEKPPVRVEGDDLIYILHTSGSTGKPKGVQIRHKNMVNFLYSMQETPGIRTEDKVLAITPISFDMAVLLYLPLISGSELVLADVESSKDGRILLALLIEKRISWMIATPSTWEMIISSGWESPMELLAISAGEALNPKLAKQLLERCSEVWNGYGPTETTVMILMKRILSSEQPITLGKPLANTKIYILDKYGNRVPIGHQGEICISGANIGAGYYGQADLTMQSFVPDPFAEQPGSLMYRSGDLGKFTENGEIYYLGRIDNQVKIRGHRIELGEIEHTLTRQNGIQDAVVLAVSDHKGDKNLVAYIIPDTEGAIGDQSETHHSPTQLSLPEHQVKRWKNALREQLPDYMVPTFFVALNRFPLTPNGKTDRKKLPDPQLAAGRSDKADHKKPANPTEQLLFDIWSELLQIRNISTTSNFFELGGHSLIAVKVMLAIEKRTGIRLPLSSLFEHSTIEKLAALIQGDTSENEWFSLVPIKTTGSKPPLYIVHGNGMNVLVFHSLAKIIDPDQPVFGIQAQGLNGKDLPPATVEEIASAYLDEILQQNPNGPYALAGYSAGGVIAFEMAKQLQAMQKSVSFFALLDTYPNVPYRRYPLYMQLLYPFLKIIYTFIFLFRYPKAYLTDKFNFLYGTLYNWYAANIKRQPALDPADPHVIVKRIQDIHNRAHRKYYIRPYDGNVYLFKSNNTRTTYVPYLHSNGWKPYIKGKLSVIDVPAAHLDFFQYPQVSTLARQLESAIQQEWETGTKK